MYFVECTDECREHAKRYGKDAEKELNGLKSSIKEKGLDVLKEKAPPYRFKRRAGDYRWIAREYLAPASGEKVIIIIDVVSKDKNFGSFLKNPEQYGRVHFEPLAAELDLDRIVAAQQPPSPPLPQKRMLNEAETHFIIEPAAKTRCDDDVIGDVICESREWTDEVRSVERLSWLPRIRDAIGDIYTAGADGVADGTELRFQIPEHDGSFIDYQWLRGGSTLFLYGIGTGENKSAGAIPAEKIAEKDLPFFRAYPVYMLDNEVFWMNIEKDLAGNFALSEEEESFLHAGEDGGQFQFPVFINGRAGSGKSTVLQYLYAEYFARWVRGDFKGKYAPVYFACNAELLQRARDFVASILIRNPNYKDQHKLSQFVKSEPDGTVVQMDGYSQSFKEFKSFLLGLIPDDVRMTRFPARQYVDYARYYKLWEKRYGKVKGEYSRDEFGPEVSWHVIRTFIKGQAVDGYMSADEYEKNVPKRRKSVSTEVFSIVFQEVWDKWYRKETCFDSGGTYWDDQDLVRYVVKNKRIQEKDKFFGVFCDESQDFTQVELDAIFQLSIFSVRTLYPHQVRKLPYVFAGDELQTLNPTGFKWDAITEAFTNKVLKEITQVAGGKASLDTNQIRSRSLICNYRSQAKIVQFCNAVQLLRADLFHDNSAEPQKEWQWVSDQFDAVAFFDETEGGFWETIKKRDDVIFVLPCHKGEEISFIQGDPVLRKRFHVFPESGTTIPPTLSAVGVKGLEHTCVVVCGFGKYLLESKLNIDERNTEGNVSLEYFMNRLYVAVSRARQQMYIVDSEEGRRALWDALSNEIVKNGRLSKFPNFSSVWEDHIVGWKEGTSDSLVNRTKGFSFERLAMDLKMSAERDRDASMMHYAAEYFEKTGKCTFEARYCYAMFELYSAEENTDREATRSHLLRAAEKFAENIGFPRKDNNSLEMAVECLWRVDDDSTYDRLAQIDAKYHKQAEQNIKLKTALAIAKKDPVLLGKSISNIVREVELHGAYELSSVEWKNAIDRTVSTLAGLTPEKFKVAVNGLAKLVESDVAHPTEKDAGVFGDALVGWGELEKARLFYKAGKVSTGDLYHKAMFAAAYPDYIGFCRLDEKDEVAKVVADYSNPENAQTALTAKQIEVVAEAYSKSGELHKVARLLSTITNAAFFESLYKAYHGKARVALIEAYCVLVLRKMNAIESVSFMLSYGSEDRADCLNPIFMMRCMARMSAEPVSNIPQDMRKGIDEIFTSLLTYSRAITDNGLWPEMLKAGYLFASPECQTEINVKAGGDTVARQGRSSVVSGWDQLLAEVLDPKLLAATEDENLPLRAETKTDEGPDIAIDFDASKSPHLTETLKPEPDDGCVVVFEEPPAFKYSTGNRELLFSPKDDRWDCWRVDKTGVWHGEQLVGANLRLTETMSLILKGNKVRITDDQLSIDFTIEL